MHVLAFFNLSVILATIYAFLTRINVQYIVLVQKWHELRQASQFLENYTTVNYCSCCIFVDLSPRSVLF